MTEGINTMKSMKNLVGKMALVAGAALAVMAGELKAANIAFATKVAGYPSAGWIQVKPELRSVLGGRVAYMPQHGGWVTDRVQRGEQIRVSVTNERGERAFCQDISIAGVVASNGFARAALVKIPFTANFTVLNNPSFDNVTVITITDRVTSRRVPIGSRPR